MGNPKTGNPKTKNLKTRKISDSFKLHNKINMSFFAVQKTKDTLYFLQKHGKMGEDIDFICGILPT